MNIDLKKPIQFVSEQATKDGWVATVVTDTGMVPYCLLGVATNLNPQEYSFPMQWRADGTSGNASYWDIRNVSEKLKVDVWLNVYRMSNGSTKVELYPTQNAAKCWDCAYEFLETSPNKRETRIIERSACLHVTAEVEEGHGLTLKKL